MPNSTQRAVSRILGDGAGQRLDYSGRQLTRKVPSSVQEFDALRLQAHDEGPGSDSWNDYHALLQAGLDRDELPEAGGGVPRHIADTAQALAEAAASRQQHFQAGRIDPALLNKGWQGRSFADWGYENSRQIVAEQMATALPHERAQWLEIDRALNDSPTTSWGVSYEASETGLEWHAPMADNNSADPSGLSQHFAGRSDSSAPALTSLLIRNQNNDPALAGIDMATVGSGGGTWWADLAMVQNAAANGQAADFHQGDTAFEPITPL